MPAPERSKRGVYSQTAQGLTAFAIDYFEQTYDTAMPRRTMGAYTKWAKEVLEDGLDWKVAREAIRLTIDHGRSAASLTELVVPAAKFVRDMEGVSYSAVEEARAMVAADGWPTGCRFIRGTHSGNYVHDTFGYDQPPWGYDVGFKRPSLADIARAIEARRSH